MKIIKDDQGKRIKKPQTMTNIQTKNLNKPRRNLKTLVFKTLKVETYLQNYWVCWTILVEMIYLYYY